MTDALPPWTMLHQTKELPLLRLCELVVVEEIGKE